MEVEPFGFEVDEEPVMRLDQLPTEQQWILLRALGYQLHKLPTVDKNGVNSAAQYLGWCNYIQLSQRDQAIGEELVRMGFMIQSRRWPQVFGVTPAGKQLFGGIPKRAHHDDLCIAAVT